MGAISAAQATDCPPSRETMPSRAAWRPLIPQISTRSPSAECTCKLPQGFWVLFSPQREVVSVETSRSPSSRCLVQLGPPVSSQWWLPGCQVLSMQDLTRPVGAASSFPVANRLGKRLIFDRHECFLSAGLEGLMLRSSGADVRHTFSAFYAFSLISFHAALIILQNAEQK